MKNSIFKNKFDLVISIGEDCACTSYLRRCNLQYNSYPFDWLTNAPFENRIKLLCEDFKDFLNIEDLKQMPKPAAFEADSNHDYYENTRNQLYFWHDFPCGIELKSSYKEVYEKYKRRIGRLYKEIEKSEKILFVWLSHIKLHSADEVVGAYKKLREKFGGRDVFLLIIENSNTPFQELSENNHVMIIHQDTVSRDRFHHYNQTMGNKANNLRVFRKIKLKTTPKEKLKKLICRLFIFIVGLIPLKKPRQSIKAKINMYFYHAKL